MGGMQYARLDDTVAELNYGVVCVNTYQQFVYENPLARWGPPPGAYTEDAGCMKQSQACSS
eukprot:5704918-Amphidinium_carterae.1